jgi:hypothetical protein
MARRRKLGRTHAPGQIQPEAVYTRSEAQTLLRLGEQSFSAEVRAGRLKRVGEERYWKFRGQWLLDWLEAQAAAQPAGL